MKKIIYLVFVFVCAGGFAQEQKTVMAKKPTVVVMPFEAKGGGIEQDDCDVVTEIFESEYARTSTAIVVNRSTLKKIQEEQKFQASDWSNNSKTAKLGEALNAQQLVSGQLRLFNNIVFVIVQVQDIKTLAVLASVNIRVKDTMELLDKIPSVCDGLVAQLGGTAKNAQGGDASNKQYKIGDTGPGGGYVFYCSLSGFPVYSGDKMTICHYLECSPDLVGDRATWCPCAESPYCKVDTNTAIGAGKKNTENILSANHKGKALYAFNCAAKVCAEYSTKTTKAGEWYLPSKDELNLIYTNLVKQGIIKSDRCHWSSSQFNSYCAWDQRFSDGNQDYKYSLKSVSSCVRAVRAF